MSGATEKQQVLIGHLWTWKMRYLEGQANFNEINRKYFKIQSSGTTITVHQFHEDVIMNEKKLLMKAAPPPLKPKKSKAAPKKAEAAPKKARIRSLNARIPKAICRLHFFKSKNHSRAPAGKTRIKWNRNQKTAAKKIPKLEFEPKPEIKCEENFIFTAECVPLVHDTVIKADIGSERIENKPDLAENKDDIYRKIEEELNNIFNPPQNHFKPVTILDIVKSLPNEDDNSEIIDITENDDGQIEHSEIPDEKLNILNESDDKLTKYEPGSNLVSNDLGEESTVITIEDSPVASPDLVQIEDNDPISLDSDATIENRPDARPVYCDLCYKQFACNVSLMAHRKIDHYMCGFCGDAFLYDGELDDHANDCGLFDLDSKSDSVACMVQLVMRDISLE